MSIPVVKVPTFSMTLPVSKEKIEFRPFLVKEEKLLLMAKEADNTEDSAKAIVETVESCTYGAMKAKNYCLADIQYAFIHIRGKSIGEDFDLTLICGKCKATHPYQASIHDFIVENVDSKNNIIAMDGIKVELRYPDVYHYGRMMSETGQVSHQVVYEIITECIVKIYSEDEMFENSPEKYPEVREFIENLTVENFSKFENFFINMPLLKCDIDFTCKKCSTSNNLTVDGIRNFFQ